MYWKRKSPLASSLVGSGTLGLLNLRLFFLQTKPMIRIWPRPNPKCELPPSSTNNHPCRSVGTGVCHHRAPLRQPCKSGLAYPTATLAGGRTRAGFAIPSITNPKSVLEEAVAGSKPPRGSSLFQIPPGRVQGGEGRCYRKKLVVMQVLPRCGGLILSLIHI